MPSEPHGSDSESASSFNEPLRRPKEGLRGSRSSGRDDTLPGSGKGLAPREAIHDWIEFAKAKGYHLVAGKRKFDLDIDRINTIIQEEQSLFEFCRDRNIGGSEKLLDLLKGPATKAGFEHRVFYQLENDPPRVTKITLPPKYGRYEHTPYLYLERLALCNELFPSLDIRVEDCVLSGVGEHSIVSSMQAFSGPPPSLEEIDRFLTLRGFSKLSDGSITIDYQNLEAGLNLRDCHPRNWVRSEEGLLFPIDIVPEVV